MNEEIHLLIYVIFAIGYVLMGLNYRRLRKRPSMPLSLVLILDEYGQTLACGTTRFLPVSAFKQVGHVSCTASEYGTITSVEVRSDGHTLTIPVSDTPSKGLYFWSRLVCPNDQIEIPSLNIECETDD